MVYHFLLLSDEVDNFAREIQIDSEATFLAFNDAILDSVGYTKQEMTSFFTCSDNWEKEQEITLMEMDTNSDVDSYLMAETKLDEMIEDEGQRLIFIFDNMTERAFFIELKQIITNKTLKKAHCTFSEGKAPEQNIDLDAFSTELKTAATNDFDTDFYGSDGFNEDELDEEGFGDMSIDDVDSNII